MNLSKDCAYITAMADILEKLFSSSSRIKIIRLFFLNPRKVFSIKEISHRAKVVNSALRREILLLERISFIKRASDYAETRSKTGRIKKERFRGWALNPTFPLLAPLKNLVLNVVPISKAEVLKKLRTAGNIKLVILSGIFIQEDESRVDLLIVGDNIKKNILEKEIRNIEALLGKELVYSVLSTEECTYRLGMYDKFIRDVLDYPHEKILNKLDVE